MKYIEDNIKFDDLTISGINILYYNRKIGLINLDGIVEIYDHKILADKITTKKIKAYATKYYQSYSDEELNKTYNLLLKRYDIKKAIIPDTGNYEMYNVLDHNKPLAYITGKPEAILIDKNLPKDYQYSFYKSFCFSNKISNKKILFDRTVYNNEQLNMIIYAMYHRVEHQFIIKNYLPKIPWKMMLLMSLASQLSFKEEEINFLISLIDNSEDELIVYGIFKAFVEECSHIDINNYYCMYHNNELGKEEFKEILLALIHGLKKYDLAKMLSDKENIKAKRLELIKYHEALNNSIKKNYYREYLIDNILDYPIFKIPKPKEKPSFNIQKFLNLKKEVININQEFDLTKITFSKTSDGVILLLNKSIIAKIYNDKTFNINQHGSHLSDDEVGYIEELIIQYINNNKHLFKLEYEFNISTENNIKSFYRSYLKDRKNILVARISEHKHLEIYAENLSELELMQIYKLWLFEPIYDGESKFYIIDDNNFTKTQKQMMVSGLIKGLKLKDILLFAKEGYTEDEMYQILVMLLEGSSIDEIKKITDDIDCNYLNNHLKDDTFINATLEELFESDLDSLNLTFEPLHIEADGRNDLVYLLKKNLNPEDYQKIISEIDRFNITKKEDNHE